MYTKFENGECVIMCLYVYDMIIFATCNDIVSQTIIYWIRVWNERHEWNQVILGVIVIRKGNSILLYQEQYIENFLGSLTIMTLN